MSEYFDNEVRIESLILIEGAITDEDSFPQSFEDFCEGLPEKPDSPLYAQLPALARFADAEDYPEPVIVAEALFRARGFLVQAATPVRHYQGAGAFYSGWGNYYTEWLYTADAAEIERLCVEWASKRHADDEAKAVAS